MKIERVRRALPPLLLLLLGCRPSTLDFVHLDLLVGDLSTSTHEPVAREDLSCADQTQYVAPLREGEELSAVVEVAREATLFVGGCAQVGGDVVELVAEPVAGGFARRLAVALERPGAWRDTLDLSPGSWRLRLRAEVFDEERPPLLQQYFVRHRALPRPAPGAVLAGPRILLVSVDTLRADAIAALGGRGQTPHLDRLVAESEVWERAYTAATWTKPAHGSLLTGQSPPVHGAGGREGALRPEVPTLQGALRDAGLATAGLVSEVDWLRPKFGFARGFESYHSVRWPLPQMARHAGDWMKRHRGQPFFYFLHTFEPHSDFRTLPYEGTGATRREVAARFGVPLYGCRQRRCASSLLSALERGELAPLPAEPEILRFLYAAGVRRADRTLGWLFDELRAADMWDDLLVVVTSDHGEALLEHPRGVLHGIWHEEVMRVPLIVKWPGAERAGTRRAEAASLLDVAPTLLAAAGLQTGELPGVVLSQAPRRRPIFVWENHPTVIHDDLKLVTGRNIEDLLFDLAADPGERRDLAAERAGDAVRLRRLLAARAELDERTAARLGLGARPVSAVVLDAKEQARLRALGYLGD